MKPDESEYTSPSEHIKKELRAAFVAGARWQAAKTAISRPTWDFDDAKEEAKERYK